MSTRNAQLIATIVDLSAIALAAVLAVRVLVWAPMEGARPRNRGSSTEKARLLAAKVRIRHEDIGSSNAHLFSIRRGLTRSTITRSLFFGRMRVHS